MTKSELKIKLDEFKKYLVNNELAEKTIKSYFFDINLFLLFIPSDKTEITKEHLMDYKNYLMNNKKLKESSINRKIISINKFMRWCGLDEINVKNVRITKKFDTDIITLKEYHRILDFAEGKKGEKAKDLLIYYGVKTLACTGVRYSELRFFTVEALKKGEIKIYNKGRVREIQTGDIGEIAKELLAWAKVRGITSGMIFTTKNGTFIKNEQFSRRLKKVVGKARGIKLEKVHPHAFRHLFAINYLETTNNDFAKVANVLGHSSLEVTRIYLQSDKKTQKDDMDKLYKKINSK